MRCSASVYQFLSPTTMNVKDLKQVKGTVLLSVVGILLSLITLALWATSSLLASEFQANKRSRAYVEVMNTLHNNVTLLIEQLRTSEDWRHTASLFAQASVTATDYVGQGSQHLTLFTVAMVHPATSLFIRQGFLRHPALVRLPNAGKITGASNSILPSLFERHHSRFTPMYFPEPLITSECQNLTSSLVIWVRGDCHIPSSETIGALKHPVLLVVEKGDFTLDTHAQIYGLVVILSDSSMPANAKATIASSAELVGAIVSNEDISTFFDGHINFDISVLRTLQYSSGLQKMQPIPGSWHDFD